MAANPATFAALAFKAEQLVEAHEFRSAIPLLECILGGTHDVEQAPEAPRGSTLTEPEELRFALMLARCHDRMGEHDTALRGALVVQQRLCGATVSAALALRLDATTLAMQASRSMSNWRQCASLAEQVLMEDGGSVPALCALAMCLENSGNTQRAATLYRSALVADPFCVEAFDALASHYLLPPSELLALVDELNLPPGTESVQEMYRVRVASPGFPAAVPAGESLAAPAVVESCVNRPELPLPHTTTLLRQASTAYAANQLQLALQFTAQIVAESPFHRDGLALHLAVLTDLRATPKLYNVAHTLMAQRPKHALPVYAAGCYYYALNNFEKAGHFFCRAAEMDPTLPHAQIALGHCYARLEEGEQALAAYRKAQAAFPALHHCALFLGMQYSRVQNWALALCCLEDARRIAPSDALVLNEIGTIHFRSGRLKKALHYLQMAWAAIPRSSPSECTDCIVFNLATVYRKLKEYGPAIELYTLAVRLRPFVPQGHVALGLTHHILGNTKQAVEHYHAALALKPDIFCRDVLERALAEEYGHGVGGAAWGAANVPGVSPSPFLFSTVPRPRAGSSAASDPHLSPLPPPPASISVGRTLTY